MPSTRLMPTADDGDRPRLAPHVKLRFDRVRERHVLLAPETVSVLNATGATILGLCDGQRTVADIVAELNRQYENVPGEEVRLFLGQLAARHCVEVGDG
jgi:pyrroloquinoline quinone biosynthesis protein D